MANIKSQKKRNLTNAKRHERNKAVRAELKARIKTAEAAPDDAEAVRAAVKRIDMAATKGVIHKNTAARMKSRMMRHVAASTAS
jgi:small subunit ribosomal protein S20